MTVANIRLLSQIIVCFYCVRYQTTTRSLARYSSYSLRTLFRFLRQDHEWIKLRLLLLKAFVFQEGQHFIAAIDEVVEGKSGKESFGLSRFYSSIAGKPIAGVCFFGFSLIEVNKRCSYFMGAHQVVYTPEDKARISQLKTHRQAGKVRALQGACLPKGRKKGAKAEPAYPSASLRTFQALWAETMGLLKKHLPTLRLTHVVADSAYGTLKYLQLMQAQGLHLVSRLASNAALYQVYEGDYSGKGRKRVYGAKWNLMDLADKYCKARSQDHTYRYEYYQLQAYSKSIRGIKLNIVVLKTTRLNDHKSSLNLFFSDDLSLQYLTMMDYYCLRFQIEFDFRDAKQHFGLADFKNYKQKNLTSFVNLSFFMCLISKIFLEQYRIRLKNEQFSVLDLKILFNARNTARKLFNLTRQQPDSIFNEAFCEHFIPDDLIHAA